MALIGEGIDCLLEIHPNQLMIKLLRGSNRRQTIPNRVPFHYLRRPAWFRTLFTRGFLTYVAGRRFVRRMRQQPEGIYARV